MQPIKSTLHRLKRYFVPCLCLVLVLSCNKEEPIPSYIHIKNIQLNTTGSEGSSSNKILDAWIYIDDQLVGAFEMPCTVPVLYEGSHVIKVLAGIKENGISETRIPYPFYETYEITATLVSGQILTLTPTVIYSQAAEFSWIEDFEGAAHSICTNTGTPDTIMEMIQSPDPAVFEGTGSSGFFLTSTNYFGMTCNKYVLPKAGGPVFLELNYNCNTDLNVGIIGYAGTSIELTKVALTLRKTTGWNKVYVNLTNDVSNAVSSGNFAIFFSMVKNPELSTSYAYLDNVKLIN